MNNPDFCYRSPYDKAFLTLYNDLAAQPYGPVSALDPTIYYPTEVQPSDYKCCWNRWGKMGGPCDCKVPGSCNGNGNGNGNGENGNGKSVAKVYGYRYRRNYGDDPTPDPNGNGNGDDDMIVDPNGDDVIIDPNGGNGDDVIIADDPCESTGFKIYDYCNYKRRPFCPINTCPPKPCPKTCYDPNDGYGKVWGKAYRSYGSRR